MPNSSRWPTQQIVQDFSFRQRELPDHDPLKAVYVDLAAVDVGRAASQLLGLAESDAKIMALDILLPNRQRALGIKMIHEADGHDRPAVDRRQKQPSVAGKVSAIDRANRHAANHRSKRRASA